MWETSLSYEYEDFTVEDDDKGIGISLVAQFEENISCHTEIYCGKEYASQVPDTILQSSNEKWVAERWGRITASDSKVVNNMGKNYFRGKLLFNQWSNYIKRKLWSVDRVLTVDMMYGITEEPAARKMYSQVKNVNVVESGLWVNKKYPHLGASPDGLIIKDNKLFGIIEIKCLKILKTRTIHDMITDIENKQLTLKNHCFMLKDGVISINKCHGYYYQMQQQLLVTEAEFCDLVLHTSLGEPFIERVFLEPTIRDNIVKNTLEFWQKIYLPEYFLMRVPRGLLPIAL